MDLHFLPLVRHAGQDQAELPGLYIAAVPRRTARGRQLDRLILNFSMEGNAVLTEELRDQLLKRLAETYYKTPGSVTAAMRNVIESLNQYLLERNLRAASSGQQGLGLLTALALRGDNIILAQCGPVHAYLLAADGVRHIFDPQPSRRGLGLGRTAPLYFAQASLSADDVLLISHAPPPSWDDSLLSGLHGQGLESVRRRLLPAALDELTALLVQARPGPGKTFLLRPRPLPVAAEMPSTPLVLPVQEAAPTEAVAPEEALEAAQPPAPEIAAEAPAMQIAQPAEPEAPPEPVESTDFAPPPPAQGVIPTPLPQEPEAPLPPIQTPLPQEVQVSYLDRQKPLPSERAAVQPPRQAPMPQEPGVSVPSRQARRRARGSTAIPAMATVGRAFGTTFGGFSQALGTLLKRMLPGDLNLPAPVMALTALIVPLAVVAVAMYIYFQRGVEGQYQSLYSQAQQAAGAAQAQTNPILQEQAWATVLQKLDAANKYQNTTSDPLRAQAQQAIDALNLTYRLDFQTAIVEGLPSPTQVKRIVATDTDLYLLDASTGSVYRGISAGRGYDIDTTFQCGPGLQGSQDIEPLVDIQLFPKLDGTGSVLLGMDSIGNLLECAPGAAPLFTLLAPPPAGWGEPVAFTIHAGDAYVLDPKTKQVWVYGDGNFSTPPDLFFDQNIPPLEDAIGLAAGQEDLFLLHQDGHITLCSISGFGVASTQCTDPMPYLDARPGREGQPLVTPSSFIEVRATQPPDPSLYLLEPGTPAVYHFSLRLAYQRQLQPQRNLATTGAVGARPATAFALSPDGRVMFLAFGNEVFYAGMP